MNICKQRVEKNFGLEEKEERLDQKRRKAKPKEFRDRNRLQKEKNQRVERIDGEICCHLLIPINHWHIAHPADDVGE